MIVSCFSDEIDSSLDVQIRVIKELGLRHLEIRTVDDVNVMDLEDSTVREIYERTRDEGLTITCVSSPIGKDDVSLPVETAVEQVRLACSRADVFGCRFIRVFSFYQGDRLRSEAFPLSVERLDAMAHEAAANDKILVVEGGDGTVCKRSAYLKMALDMVNSPNLKCVFDPSAFLAAGDDPLLESLPRLENQIEYMHIKDSRFDDVTRCVAGEGDCEIPSLLDHLRYRRDLVISLEPHLAYAGIRRGFSGIEPFREAHRALKAILDDLQIDYR
jgi:sugar phosphate isomerase/epimerase